MPDRPRDLEPRTFAFAQRVRRFVDQLPRSLANDEDAKQLVRVSGSLAANYLEAEEGLGRKEFFYRIKVCRTEARECGLWLRLLDVGNFPELVSEGNWLVNESEELKRIFSSIAAKDEAGEMR